MYILKNTGYFNYPENTPDMWFAYYPSGIFQCANFSSSAKSAHKFKFWLSAFIYKIMLGQCKIEKYDK